MSNIQEIMEHREWQAEKGHMPTDYQYHLDLLSALDILTDQLERIAIALERTYTTKQETETNKEQEHRAN